MYFHDYDQDGHPGDHYDRLCSDNDNSATIATHELITCPDDPTDAICSDRDSDDDCKCA